MNIEIDHHAPLLPADAPPFDFDRPELQIPAWVKGKWPRHLQTTFFAIGFLLAFIASFGATGDALKSYAVLMAIYFVSVIAHEAGHWLGASVAGRRVIAAQLSWIGLWRLRRGWRVRLSRPHGAAGWVSAVPMPGRTPRLANAVFVAGGASANALLAALGLLVVARYGLGQAWVWFVLAAMNLAMLLASLTPHAAQYFSDGLHLVALARGKRSAKLGELIEHIVSRAIAGRVDIPLPEIQALLQGPSGTATLARYLMICAHLRNGSDERARAEAVEAIAACEKLEAPEKRVVASLTNLIQFELALIDMDAATLRSIRIDKDFEFRAPYLPLRRQAFLAAIEGNIAAAEKALAQHEALSENSIDAGSRASERIWRERIRAMMCKSDDAANPA